MSDIQVCIHCGNAVEEIDYGENPRNVTYGSLENKFKHKKPRPYPVCNKNPIMDDDVHWVQLSDYGR